MDSPNEEYTATAIAVKEVKKATIYFDKTTKKQSLEKKDRNQPRYLGEIADGIPSGNGTLYLQDGFYEGEFKNGETKGEGTYKWKDGNFYKGSFRKGDKHGHGIYTFIDGRKWVGEFR